MAAAWFYNHRGRLQGPYSSQEILQKIEANELGPDDLVYQEGKDKWKPVSTVAQFKKALPPLSEDEKKVAEAERAWVVLDRSQERGNRQLGPYSTDEIQGMLSRGELKLSDYVWRSGMKEWYRIRVFPELVTGLEESPGAAQQLADTPDELPESTQVSFRAQGADSSESSGKEDELSEVMQITYKQVPVDSEPLPEGATGPDLTKSKLDPRDEELLKSRLDYKLKPEVLKKVRESVQTGNWLLEKLRALVARVEPRWIGMALGAVLVLLLARGTWLRLSEWMDWGAEAQVVAEAEVQSEARRPTKRAAPKREARKKSAAPKAVAPAPTRRPKPTTEPRRPASYVKLSYNNKAGTLVTRTDATKHFKTTLTFSSLLGKVIGAQSYHRILRRSDRKLDLRELSWPRGYYRVEGQMGEHRSVVTVFIGSPSNYSKDLRGYKKDLTLDFMNERVAFILVAEELADKAKVFEKILRAAGNSRAWRRDYGPWRRSYRKTNHVNLRRIGPRSRDRYVMAELWLDLQEARSAYDSFTRGLAGKSVKQKTGSLAVARQHSKKLKSLANQAQNLSLWK